MKYTFDTQEISDILAKHVAAQHGLPLPLPVTLRYRPQPEDPQSNSLFTAEVDVGQPGKVSP